MDEQRTSEWRPGTRRGPPIKDKGRNNILRAKRLDLTAKMIEMRKRGLPMLQISRQLGIANETAHRWYKIALEEGKVALQLEQQDHFQELLGQIDLLYSAAMPHVLGRAAEYDAEGRVIRAEVQPSPAGIQAAAQVWERKAKLLGVNKERPTVNVLVGHPEWARFKHQAAEALARFPEAQQALLEAMQQQERPEPLLVQHQPEPPKEPRQVVPADLFDD